MSYESLRVLLSSTILLGFALHFTGTEGVQIPDTPAGRQFSAWLSAINSGDRDTLQAFMDKSMPGRPVEQGLAIRSRSGGYDAKKVDESSDTRIAVLVQERGPTKQFARVTVNVAKETPDRIAGILIQPAQPPPELAPAKLTASEVEAARAGAAFRQFSAWLEAFNSGDRDRISQFLTANFPSRNLDAEMRFRGQTTGFEFRALEQA